MLWILSLTLSVCVFNFSSMLVNIYVVYCILKNICHRSYIAYHFIFVTLCLILCLYQCFIWQCICWDVNVHLSLNVNRTHIFCWWMQWTLSLTLSVCVFDFGSMLVNIYVVYCILKCICHRSYIAYHFLLSHYVSYYAIYVNFNQWISCNIFAGMSMCICHWIWI